MGWRARRNHRNSKIDEPEGTPTPEIVWGMPTACPECGGRGYLDRIDLVKESMFQHCVDCGRHWETARQDTTLDAAR